MPVVRRAVRLWRPRGSGEVPRRDRRRSILQLDTLSPFPIDLVFTWVDLDEPARLESLARYGGDVASLSDQGEEDSQGAEDLYGTSRYRSNDELRYALRSVELYAPWVRHIYVVTDGTRPPWLVESDRLSVVAHTDILDEQYLPTFNSHVIESALQRIPGLAEHFLYLNDDVMFLAPVDPGDFFTENGLMLIPLGRGTIDDGPALPEENANEWGSKNAAALVEKAFGFRPERRLRHQAQPQLRSVAERSEARFPEAYHLTRSNRFRTIEDVLCTGFLHPWSAYMEGRALCIFTKGWFVRVRLRTALDRYARIIEEKDRPNRRKFGCFNDGANLGELLEDHATHLRAALEQLFPEPSPHERADA